MAMVLSAGVRYQFTPEMIAAVMPVKVKAPPHPQVAPTNWTGFYVGGVVGADYGRTDILANSTPSMQERPWVMGVLGGGLRPGYNRQFNNNWVLGVEGDIVATNTHCARPCLRLLRLLERSDGEFRFIWGRSTGGLQPQRVGSAIPWIGRCTT